jgi:hypothetical protein
MTNNSDKNTANTNVELSEEQLDGINGGVRVGIMSELSGDEGRVESRVDSYLGVVPKWIKGL